MDYALVNTTFLPDKGGEIKTFVQALDDALGGGFNVLTVATIKGPTGVNEYTHVNHVSDPGAVPVTNPTQSKKSK